MVFPDDGVVITVAEGEEFSDDGNFIVYPGTYAVLDYNKQTTTLIKSGTTEIVYNETIPSAGTYATVATDGDDYFVLKEGEEKLTVLSGGTFVSTNDIHGEYYDLQRFGNAIVESGGTFGVFYACLGEKNKVLFNTEKFGSVNVPQQNFAKIPLLPGTFLYKMLIDGIEMDINELTIIKSGTTEISGETMVIWTSYILDAILFFASKGDKVGDNVYYAGYGSDIEINEDDSYEILSVGTKKSKTYASWQFEYDSPVFVLSDGQNIGSTSYFAVILDGGTYISYDLPLQFIAKDVVSDGQECVVWEYPDGSVCSFGDAVGSALYDYESALELMPIDGSESKPVRIKNIRIGYTFLYPIQKSVTIKDGDSVFAWSYIGKDGLVSLTDTVGSTIFFGKVFDGYVDVAGVVGTIDAIDVIDDNTQPIVWYDILEDSFCISFNENPGFMTYDHNDYETFPIGKVNEKIEIPEGTLYKKFLSSKDGVVGPSDEVGSYVFYTMYGDGNIGHVAFSEKTKIISKQTVYSGGKGVITRMKDEYSNDLPYDFKNMQFKRWKISNLSGLTDTLTQHNYGGKYLGVLGKLPGYSSGSSYVNYVSIEDTTDFIWAYTFSGLDALDGGTVTDASIDGSSTGNIIMQPYYDKDIIIHGGGTRCYNCGNNVFYGTARGNIIGPNCSCNTSSHGFRGNNLGSGCENNIFMRSVYGNIFLNDFSRNFIGELVSYNVFGYASRNNVINYQCNYNFFGDGLTTNEMDDYVQNNIIGNSFRFNSIRGNFNHNTIGNYVGGTSVASGGCSVYESNFNYNTIGNSCQRINFEKAYIESVCVEDGNQRITITSTETTSSSNKLRNFIVGRGVNNTTRRKTISHDTVNDTIRTTYEPSGSTIVNV